ncbi:MAG: nitroreductase family protein [Nanoarchaeota archaeon]
MEFMDVIKKRRSIRKFKDKKISNELIEKMIDAARWAPSGMNAQPWQFIAIKDKDNLKQVREMYTYGREYLKIYAQDTSFVENGIIILVLASKATPWAKSDCYLAIQNILLAATDLGLGSLLMGAMMVPENLSKLMAMCKIDPNYEVLMPIAIGYADEDPKTPEKKAVRDILHYEIFR